jgi:ABC-type Fe3+/spermidine/putrescine transport system ATPase subunit
MDGGPRSDAGEDKGHHPRNALRHEPLGNIDITNVSRSFASVVAVDDISLQIKAGEFFTLLGPSGCGKTTLLRLIAGFCALDTGQISVGGKRIDALPPHRRNIGMVFQNYAIFPNLSVAGNVAYGLKARKLAAAELNRRLAEALNLVRLQGYGERRPHQLSGGQLQRVAIARALVDARLRVEMRGEIRDLQRRLNITTVYVTHDQEEALAVSQRIAVMQAGRIEQLGGSHEIYRRPLSLFTAQFMGTTNVLPGIVAAREGNHLRVRVGAVDVIVADHRARQGEAVTLCLRPEALRIVEAPAVAAPGEARLEATVVSAEFAGAVVRLNAELPGGTPLKIAVLDDPDRATTPGNPVALAYHPARITVFRQGAA